MSQVSLKEKYTDLWPTNYKVGMWFWLLHRVTGLYIIVYGIIHLWEISISLMGADGAAFDWFFKVVGLNPFIQFLDILTMFALLYHGMNGLRVILFDFGLGIRRQKTVFLAVMAVGFVVWVATIIETLPFITGRPLF
ncbi:MAG: succinate dehydrogenase, cytochrome b556 subunit [Dehalococcoidia bacterium]|nr:succinate dehydrogenase, cytochrome b556 subunit [Dehalococcoidia bacterium]